MTELEKGIRAIVAEVLRDALPAAVRAVLAEVRDADADEFLSVASAARFADVDPSTIRAWVRTGKLPRHATPVDKPGKPRTMNGREVPAPAGQLRIRRADLERLLAGETSEAGELTPEQRAARDFG